MKERKITSWVVVCCSLLMLGIGALSTPVLGGLDSNGQRPLQLVWERGARWLMPGAFAEAATLQVEDPPLLPNCRYGFSPLSSAHVSSAAPLGAGWYLNFIAGTVTPPANVEFVPMVSTKQLKDDVGTYLEESLIDPPLNDDSGGLGWWINKSPGALWIIGNEVDRGPDPGKIYSGQGDMQPDFYAQTFHEVVSFIKARDPAAQIAIAGLVQVTPGRLQYLDLVMASYYEQFGTPMPVDVWTMHLYILPEALPNGESNGIATIAVGTDPALAIREGGNNTTMCPLDNIYCFAEHDSQTIFQNQIVAMRSWMKANGQQNKPLILTEYSLSFPFEDYDDPINPTSCFLMDEYQQCFTEARVLNYLNGTINYMETATDADIGNPLDNHRLVQQWLWYASHTEGAGKVSNLLSDPGTPGNLSNIGTAFAVQSQARVWERNLKVTGTDNPVYRIWSEFDIVTATIGIDLINNGNTHIETPFTVVFKDQFNNVIDTVTISDALQGCARPNYRVEVEWFNLAQGVYPYTVEVDNPNLVAEMNEADNNGAGVVQVYHYAIFLPLTPQKGP